MPLYRSNDYRKIVSGKYVQDYLVDGLGCNLKMFNYIKPIYEEVCEWLPEIEKANIFLRTERHSTDDDCVVITNFRSFACGNIKHVNFILYIPKYYYSIRNKREYDIRFQVAHELRHVYQVLKKTITWKYSAKSNKYMCLWNGVPQSNYASSSFEYAHLGQEKDANNFAIEFCGGVRKFIRKAYRLKNLTSFKNSWLDLKRGILAANNIKQNDMIKIVMNEVKEPIICLNTEYTASNT